MKNTDLRMNFGIPVFWAFKSPFWKTSFVADKYEIMNRVNRQGIPKHLHLTIKDNVGDTSDTENIEKHPFCFLKYILASFLRYCDSLSGCVCTLVCEWRNKIRESSKFNRIWEHLYFAELCKLDSRDIISVAKSLKFSYFLRKHIE